MSELVEFFKWSMFFMGCVATILFLLLNIDIYFSNNWLQRIRLIGFTYVNHTKDGSPQPDGKVYTDTYRLEFTAVMALPEDGSFRPFKIALSFHHPKGMVYRVPSVVVKEHSTEVHALFSVDVNRLLKDPETWHGKLELEDIDHLFKDFILEVPQCRSLLEDLETKEAALFSARHGRREVSNAVCAETDSVEFLVRLVPKTYPLAKYTSVTLRARVIHLDSNTETLVRDIPLTRDNGLLNAAVPCSFVREAPGKWEVTLETGNRILTQKTFSVISSSELLKGIRGEILGLLYKSNSGQYHPIEKAIFASDVISIKPHLKLCTPFPTKLFPCTLVCVVTNGRKQIHEQTMVITLSEKEFLPQLDEIPMIGLGKDVEVQEWAFTFKINDRVVAKRIVAIRRALPPLAHIQSLLPEPEPALQLESKPKKTRKKQKRAKG